MENQNKCRAKNPETCWRHGTGLGFTANREIREILSNDSAPQHTAYEIFSKALKTYDSSDLASVIVAFADSHHFIDGSKIREALKLASDLHKTDTRANRAQYDRTPYIEHPLRNALRIIRYGNRDTDNIASSLLHDTVEDHPYELAMLQTKTVPRDEHEARDLAFAYIQKRFGSNVERIVRGMSNPIIENKYMPATEKNIIYRDHFVEAVEDPDVCVNKTADITDNALSLNHTESTMTPISLYKKSSKYLLVLEPLEQRLKRGYFEGNMPVSDRGLQQMIFQIQEGRKKVLALNQRAAEKLGK